MTELKSKFVCEIIGQVDTSQYQEFGVTQRGKLRIAPHLEGTVNGPKIKGDVTGPGADWLLFRPDGRGDIDVRLTIRTDDGELIYYTYGGILYVPPEVSKLIKQGKAVDHSEYYIRTTPVFETGAEKYRWLTQHVFVGVGTLIGKGRLKYRIYQIL